MQMVIPTCHIQSPWPCVFRAIPARWGYQFIIFCSGGGGGGKKRGGGREGSRGREKMGGVVLFCLKDRSSVFVLSPYVLLQSCRRVVDEGRVKRPRGRRKEKKGGKEKEKKEKKKNDSKEETRKKSFVGHYPLHCAPVAAIFTEKKKRKKGKARWPYSICRHCCLCIRIARTTRWSCREVVLGQLRWRLV